MMERDVLDVLHPHAWSIPVLVGAFAVSAVLVGVLGWRVARLAAELAERSRFGQAVIGAVLLGAGTSLPEVVVTATATLGGRPDIAISNLMGGIVMQSAVLVLADATWRRHNIEYESRGSGPILQSAVLVTMISLLLMAMVSPELVLFVVHPVSLALVAVFAYGLAADRGDGTTQWARTDLQEEPAGHSPEPGTSNGSERPASSRGVPSLFRRTVGSLALIGLASWVLTESTAELGDVLGVSDTVVGAIVIAFITSLPEFVTAVSAVHAGAVTLGISDVLGGNLFDATLPALADLLHTEGSVLHDVAPDTVFMAAAAAAVSGLTLVGIVAPERRGPFAVGISSVVVLVVALMAFAVLLAW